MNIFMITTKSNIYIILKFSRFMVVNFRGRYNLKERVTRLFEIGGEKITDIPNIDPDLETSYTDIEFDYLRSYSKRTFDKTEPILAVLATHYNARFSIPISSGAIHVEEQIKQYPTLSALIVYHSLNAIGTHPTISPGLILPVNNSYELEEWESNENLRRNIAQLNEDLRILNQLNSIPYYQTIINPRVGSEDRFSFNNALREVSLDEALGDVEFLADESPDIFHNLRTSRDEIESRLSSWLEEYQTFVSITSEKARIEKLKSIEKNFTGLERELETLF